MGDAGNKRDIPEADEVEKVAGRDLVLISRVDRTRNEIHVLKPVPDGIEEAVLRVVEEGTPLNGDLVRLHPHGGSPLLAELEVVMRHPDRPRGGRAHEGPPMVASEAYRRGWDSIFGVRPTSKRDTDAN